MRDASNWSRPIGGQPRSRPIFVIIASNGGHAMSAASCDVSAMKPCELMLSAGAVVARLERGPAVDLGERREALGHAADDRERHRQAERAGARRRGGIAADCDPDRQRILERARVDAGGRRAARDGGRTR